LIVTKGAYKSNKQANKCGEGEDLRAEIEYKIEEPGWWAVAGGGDSESVRCALGWEGELDWD